MSAPLAPLAGRYWRMVGIKWQHRPLESGSYQVGGRWNAIGTPALYLSADYTTAIVEMHQELVRPGTLIGVDVQAAAIADLREVDTDVTGCDWRQLHWVEHRTPPSWSLAADLIASGAEGALVPSLQKHGATNLVLWCWHQGGGRGEGAALAIIDPDGAFGGQTR